MANIALTLIPSLTPVSTISTGQTITFPYYGDKVKGSGYYGQTDPVHTVQYSSSNNFTGMINIQGTLEREPTDADWYNIQGTSLGNGITPVFNQTLSANFYGNHVWVRAVINSFISGAINSVLLTHN
jgi:hypothetical protein